jgi:hypothetical protein
VHPRMLEVFSGTIIDNYSRRRNSHIWVESFGAGRMTIWESFSRNPSAIPPLFISVNLYVLLSAYTTDRSINIRMLDTSWINSNLFRRWKRGCDSRQKRDCKMGPATGRLAPARPAWLIDTWRLCLVPGAVNAPYVALSYVWGKHRFFKTLKNNIAQLQNDQAFSDCYNRLGVPRTIADAISVVGLLAERYLWVDALCIVQDDESTRHDQLNNMASIFASATVTIIAQQGSDANYGLRGLRGISQTRNLPQETFTLAKGYQVAQRRSGSDVPCVWSHRGWTYQEEIFSKRTLVFAADMVEWRCGCCSCFEGLQQSKSYRNQSGLNSLSSLFSSPVPDLVGYGRLVLDYNARELTHPEDVLAAFAGITTALSQTFYGGFICGLPSLFFDIALCWEPYSTCQRRVPSCASNATLAGLPSWSWAGWKGHIITSLWAGCDYIKSSRPARPCIYSVRIILSVQWYCRPWGAKESRLIQGPKEMQALRALAQEDQKNLPRGWMRFEYNSKYDTRLGFKPSWESQTPPCYYYKHESIPTTEFWYPIPLCEGSQPPPPRHPERLINCHTQKTWLYVTNCVISRYRPAYSLCDAEGAGSGYS